MSHVTGATRLLLATALLLGSAACSDESPGTAGSDRTTGTAGGTDGGALEAGKRAGLECAEGAVPLTRSLSSGATWALCFAVDAKRGMVLSDVRLAPEGEKPLRIAHEVAIAQLEVPYDTGERLTSDITSAGFGGLKMQTLTETECAGERITLAVPNIGDGSTFGDVPERAVLCSEVEDVGLAYRSEEDGEVVAARHDAWTLSTISKVGWYEYVTRYTFGSDGSIAPELGATGDLSPVDFTGAVDQGRPVGPDDHDRAASHSHDAVWRIHWSLGEGPLSVEQYDASPTGRAGKQSPILTGRLTPITHPAISRRADRRWWRVVAPQLTSEDGRPASYQIDLGATDSFTFAHDSEEHGPNAGYDVAFTNADDCQIYATQNRGACGAGVLDFVAAGDRQPLADVVSWIAVGFHHVPRDEDQSPMQLHWQGFAITPRDFTAQRLDVPNERRNLNGQPKEWNGEPVDELATRGSLGQ